MVEAVNSVDAYPFFTILRTDLLHCRYKNRCFLAALCCLIVKRKLENSSSFSYALKFACTAIFSGGYLRRLLVNLLQ